jgi:uncharacterized protein
LEIIPMLPETQEQLNQLLGSDVPLGMLTDVIAYMVDIDIQHKELLLAEMNVARRAELLLEHLAALASQHASEEPGTLVFPPQFSAN